MSRPKPQSPFLFPLILFGAVACDERPDEAAAGDSDSAADTGGADWIVEVDRPNHPYDDLGLEIVTYAITAESPTGYRTDEGTDPRFHVVKPIEFSGPVAAHPVLMWLHGSAQGIEGDERFNENCGSEGIAEEVSNALMRHQMVAAEIADREWIWVVPENPWCDLWTGIGAADPVDTSHHGQEHVHTILDAFMQGFDGMKGDPSRTYGWGTSIGAAGLGPAAAGDGPPRFAAIVLDSGPVNAVNWYKLPSEKPYLDHIFGGPPLDEAGVPTAFYPNYQRADSTLLVGDGALDTPIFQIYNAFDRLVSVEQNRSVALMIDAKYSENSIRYFHHDVRHHAPGPLFHVQSGYHSPPMGYTTKAAFSFLAGAGIAWYEAENSCDEGVCRVAAESGSGELEDISVHSGGAAVVRHASNGPGILYSGPVPANIPLGAPATFLPVIATANFANPVPEDRVLRFELVQRGTTISTLDVRRADLASGESELPNAYFRQLRQTTWAIDLDGDGNADPLPEGEGLSIVVSYHGLGTAWLDGFWVVTDE